MSLLRYFEDLQTGHISVSVSSELNFRTYHQLRLVYWSQMLVLALQASTSLGNQVLAEAFIMARVSSGKRVIPEVQRKRTLG
jgi:hypothetical protein